MYLVYGGFIFIGILLIIKGLRNIYRKYFLTDPHDRISSDSGIWHILFGFAVMLPGVFFLSILNIAKHIK